MDQSRLKELKQRIYAELYRLEAPPWPRPDGLGALRLCVRIVDFFTRQDYLYAMQSGERVMRAQSNQPKKSPGQPISGDI
ncbi:hypothetical protein [Pseudooceanicola sp. 200-1SW]|uniref:hypothetical protein n=1 Tax=Pseudooceanicola sp. 200-1SW TaxID=3425949 RepID=UPI003D7F8CAA